MRSYTYDAAGQRSLDISKHQSRFDAAKAGAAGISTVILRAAYGGVMDIKFREFALECKKAGLLMGAYQFMTWHYRGQNQRNAAKAKAMMQQQTASLLRILQDQPISSWVALDQELERGQQMGLDKASNTALLNEAAAMLRKAGHHPCLYASASWVQSQVDVNALNMPIWAAYYYADPHDPDFEACTALEQLPGRYGNYLRSLGDKLCGWQYGRIGYGSRYGVGSSNVDRNWIYFQPNKESEGKEMNWIEAKNKHLKALTDKPACETFVSPDVNVGHAIKVPQGDSVQVLAVSDGQDSIAPGVPAAYWYKVQLHTEVRYAIGLSDRWQLMDTPEKPEQPEEKSEQPVMGKVALTLTDLTPGQARCVLKALEGAK